MRNPEVSAEFLPGSGSLRRKGRAMDWSSALVHKLLKQKGSPQALSYGFHSNSTHSDRLQILLCIVCGFYGNVKREDTERLMREKSV